MTKYYYEAHITIDPVFDKEREYAEALANEYGFKLAKLIMRKREADQERPAQDDTFMTGHSLDFTDIQSRTIDLCSTLRYSGFTVRRYKVEDTLVDSRFKDEWNLLV